MPGWTGSGIAAGDRLAGAWGSRFCSACPARVRRAKLGGPRVLDAVRPRAWYNGKAEGKPRIPLVSHVGRPALPPAPGKSTWEKKPRKAPPGETGRGWWWGAYSPFRLRGRVQMRV